ncbi:DUF4114 domain-containing protein [Desulfonema magnum]|uniref:Dockerin repeat-containing protein, DUF4114 n=1 Tax=Desulfonema magnum TaxID=45655 RepID=A0A975BJA5_9BACT|nr:DUF4114 domain-containing protein [Desulfonema magnum]QTA86343.1 Dockerin repeat-containing protein, DUF4114 [Desulfonema magnum]
MKKFLIVMWITLLFFGLAGSSAAFFINFEDGKNGNPVNNIEGVSFKNFSGFNAMYGDSRTGKYNTYSDDLKLSYGDAFFHHNGNFWLWAGTNADARGVIVDFTSNNGTWFKTGYSTYGDFILEAHLTNGRTVTVSGPTNIYSSMKYLTVNAPAGAYIDYVVLKGEKGNVWLADDMSGDTTGVGSDEPPPPPAPGSDDDNDGMPYAWEVANGLNPSANDAAGDPDGDGVSNLNEYKKGTNPKKADTDGDGIPDGWEISKGLNPSVNDGAADSDRDGLSNLSEYQKGTNPNKADTDGDGIPDGWEIAYGLNPSVNDGGTDSDGDGLSNLSEYQKGTNPKKADTDSDGIPDGWEIAYGLNPGANDASGDPDGDEVSNLDEYINGTDPTIIPGEFKVGENGIVKADWLYDGGSYEGEFAIFSFSGMKDFIANPEEFIKEAVRRALSNSTEGYVVLSDMKEGARFSGSLGESVNWNKGPYKGVKSFQMRPGDTFAMILTPNSTLESLAENPLTTDVNKRPLFSIVLSNLDYGMHVGQIADVNGLGTAFAYEDQDFVKSDTDYNDIIVQITGATADVPPLDSLSGNDEPAARKKRDRRDDPKSPVLFDIPPAPRWHDWRISEDLGQQIVEHIESPSVQPETFWMSFIVEGPADMIVYDPKERECGKEGGYIPGAAFETDENGGHIFSLPVLETGNYRLVLRGKESGFCRVTVKGYQGDTEISSETKEIEIQAHQAHKCDVIVSSFTDDLIFTFEEIMSSNLFYDFNGDGKIDDNDIMKVSSRWNVTEESQEYDPFYDVDDDGYIGIIDIMPVVNSMSAQ